MAKQKKQGLNFPDGHYKLPHISISEIAEKYPDKVVEVIDRERDVVLILDTCKIIFTK